MMSKLEPIDYEDKYDFVKDISPKYKCMICSKLMREPQVTECCGQHFCRYCMEKWLMRSTGKQCPHCRLPKCNYIRYLPMKREINELEIYCLNRAKGCTSTVALEQINEHITQCDFEQVRCICGLYYSLKNLQDHKQNSCLYRPINCQYCNKQGMYRIINSTIHQNECPDIPIDCPQKCGAFGIKRKNLNHHKQKCPLEMVECQYSSAGCQERVQRKDHSSHVKDYIEKHLELTMAAFTQLSTHHKTLQKDHEKLKTDHAKLSLEHDALKKKKTGPQSWQGSKWSRPGNKQQRRQGVGLDTSASDLVRVRSTREQQSSYGRGLSQDSGWCQKSYSGWNWHTKQPSHQEDDIYDDDDWY